MKAVLCTIIFLLLLGVVQADVTDVGFTNIYLEPDNITLKVIANTENIHQIYPGEDIFTIPQLQEYVKENLVLTNDGEVCDAEFVQSLRKPGINMEYTFEYFCESPLDNINVEYNLFFEVSEIHQNIVNFYIGERRTQRTLDIENREGAVAAKSLFLKYGLLNETNAEEAEIQAIVEEDQEELVPVKEQSSIQQAIQFVISGVEHILIGYDHILFVLGLVLVTLRIRQVVAIVTSFTVAHSITLVSAALGVIVLNSRVVESIIALSVVYIAAENIFISSKKKNAFFGDEKHRWKIAFLFGLIHGFGFASVLQDVGLPDKGLVLSLLSFNIGVEIGQLAIVALVLPFIWYTSKKSWHHLFVKGVSALIGLIGLFWFLERVIGF